MGEEIQNKNLLSKATFQIKATVRNLAMYMASKLIILIKLESLLR